MEPLEETASARVVTLMTPGEKSALEKKARRAGLSVGELVRRSVDAYDPEELRDLEQLAGLAAEVRRRTETSLANVARARAEVDVTLQHLRRGRS